MHYLSRVILALYLLCNSVGVTLCMEIEKLVGDFLLRVEFRPVSAELEKKAIGNVEESSATNHLINKKEAITHEIDRLSAEYASKVNETFRVSYLQPDLKDFTAFFITQLKNIAANHEGNQLLKNAIILFNLIDIINAAFPGEATTITPTKLAVSFGDGASLFSGRGSSLTDLGLSMNLNLIGNNTFFHKKLGLCTFVPCLSSVERHPITGKNIVHIRSCADPFWLLVAHESIHMTHCMLNRINNFFYDYIFGILTLESIPSKISEISTKLQRLQEVLKKNPQFQFLDMVIDILKTKHDDIGSVIDLHNFFKNPIRFHVKYKENLTMSARELVQASHEMAVLFPEIETPVRPNILDLCDKLEERETVIGSVLSELTLRLAGGFPIRYIYQDAHSCLYEYLDVVCNVIGQTAIGKTFKTSDELSGYVGSYINSASNDLYFNSRFFAQQVDHKLLPEAVFKDFGLTYVPTKPQPLIAPIIEQQQKAKPRKIFSSAKALIENTVKAFFEEKDISKTLTYLTTDGKTIKKDFSMILLGRFEEVEHIVSEVEGHLQSVTDGQYDPSKIVPLVGLLQTIKKHNFE